jgi:hypothetical protein
MQPDLSILRDMDVRMSDEAEKNRDAILSASLFCRSDFAIRVSESYGPT